MVRSTFAVLIALLCTTYGAGAQQPLPDSENGRYSFREMGGELLRLDSRTGQLSTCSKRAVGWACQIAPDERATLEGEIATLQKEVQELRSRSASRITPPETVPPTRSPSKEEPAIKLPSDADLDRVMSFFEKVWRRLVTMVQNVQKELEKGG